MRKTFLTTFFLLFIVVVCIAGETEGKIVLGLHGGANTYYGDIDDQKIGPFGDVSLFWWPSNYFALGLAGNVGFFEAENVNQFDKRTYFKSWLYGGMFLLKLRPASSWPLTPYLTAGFESYSINDPTFVDETKTAENVVEKINDFEFAVPFGGGIMIFLGENISLDLEALYHYSLTDYFDGRNVGNSNDGYVTGTMGLSFYFGKPKDTDGDGIPDKFDKDPLRREDLDGFQDADGAPEPDNDQDGIADLSDEAPNTPEDQDGFQDSDGAPDLDNDGDGIPDESDTCPGTDENIDTKEDIDGFEDEDGCPDLDNDGDGILDVDDQCPDEAETFNDYEDEDGCPDTKPEIVVDKGESIVLEGIFFRSGSAELTPNSMTILDKVERTLKLIQNIVVEIRGYTDNTGNYEGNVRLSLKRAEAVKAYLVSYGIEANRIITRGFGPDNPIAPNATRDGRAKNRRIEFYRVE
jgi:outer membrane protein OmpA-like peptidoglycan-associated protein